MPQRRRIPLSFATVIDGYLGVVAADTRRIAIRDARQASSSPRFDVEGFQRIDAPTRFSPDLTDDSLRSAYASVGDALQRLTGAARARVFDHTVRRSEHRPGERPPIRIVHADYGRTAGLRRMRELLSAGEATSWKRGRVVIANVWPSIAGVVHSAPLGVVDLRTVREEDFVPVTVVYQDRRGHIGYYRWNPDHAWYWFPFLHPSEALVFKTYDSAADLEHWSCPHASFASPAAPPELDGQRASVEFRVLLGFDPEVPS